MAQGPGREEKDKSLFVTSSLHAYCSGFTTGYLRQGLPYLSKHARLRLDRYQ